MEENIFKVRKDTVKNIAIVFLSVMLVLTFFSNSILNRSLPEVATEYVAYDSITERIRGTGTVTAQDPYKVMTKDSRVIASVAVMPGDMVMKDQVLFYLEDAESEELKTKEEEIKNKEEELNGQLLDYMTSILSVDISNAAYQNIQTDNIASVAAYQARIEASRQKVQTAQDTVDNLNRQILIAGMETGENVDRDAELAMAEANLESAESRMSAAQTQISDAESKIAQLEQKASEAGKSLETTALDAKVAVTQAKNDYKSAKETLVEEVKNALALVPENAVEYKEGKYFDKNGFPKSVDALANLKKLADENGCGASFLTFQTAYDTFLLAKNQKTAADKDLEDYKSAKSAVSAGKSALSIATNEYNTYLAKVNQLKNESTQSAGASEEYINNLKVSLSDAEKALSAAQEEQTQLLKDINSELALSEQNDKISDTERELRELKEEHAKLQADSIGATVVSPVEGTIISVNKTAGETTSPQEEVALIQVSGKGMTVSFSVTNEQASKVNVGDVAELQNAWYYDEVLVTLTKIKPDTEQPGKRKLLEFSVEGAVQNGEQLSLSVGERSAEYDLVVPNSAIREDKNGKFVFIIEEKATPFGNRYKAKRVEVEVVASDETKSAISADLEGYEYVITTSNQPVETGDQVRLADY